MDVTLIGWGMMALVFASGIAAQQLAKFNRKRFIDHTDADWRQTYSTRIVEATPTVAYSGDPAENKTYQAGVFGAFGVTPDEITFRAQVNAHEWGFDLHRVRWVGTHDVRTKNRRRAKRREALILHYEDEPTALGAGRWRVMVFMPPDPRAVANAIAAHLGQLPEFLGTERPDYGPTIAVKMKQDIYGKWHPAPKHGSYAPPITATERPEKLSEGFLYLAPDRVLFDFQHPILLKAIRELDVYYTGTLAQFNPFSEDLLRIGYDIGDDNLLAPVGFLTRRAEAMGEAISAACGVPLNVHTSRKKKA